MDYLWLVTPRWRMALLSNIFGGKLLDFYVNSYLGFRGNSALTQKNISLICTKKIYWNNLPYNTGLPRCKNLWHIFLSWVVLEFSYCIWSLGSFVSLLWHYPWVWQALTSRISQKYLLIYIKNTLVAVECSSTRPFRTPRGHNRERSVTFK